jgi:hypothetical protein
VVWAVVVQEVVLRQRQARLTLVAVGVVVVAVHLIMVVKAVQA